MQPLSRVDPLATTEWGDPETMTLRPELAAKIARCIAHWSEIEIHLGAFLGLLLHANQKAVVAMYSALENRAAQLRMITAAAQSSLPSDHFDTVSVLISSIVRPAMKERDKLAHWSWGFSPEIPDALLLAEAERTLETLMLALRISPGVEKAAVPQNFDKIWVVRAPDLDRRIDQILDAKLQIRVAMATVWDHNSPQDRAEYLRQLSNVPRIHEGLTRLARDRQKNQATPPQSPPTEPSETQ
jgi:hypothetical protein